MQIAQIGNSTSDQSMLHGVVDLIELIEEGSVLISVARPASLLKAAVACVSGSGIRHHLLSCLPAGLEDQVRFCGLDPIAFLARVSGDTKAVASSRRRRIAFQETSNEGIVDKLSFLEFETLDQIFRGIKKCSVLEIGNCRDVLGMMKGAGRLLGLAPLIIFDFSETEFEERSVAFKLLRTAPALERFSFLTIHGVVLEDEASATDTEIIIAMCDFSWSSYLTEAKFTRGNIDLAAHVLDARVKRQMSGRVDQRRRAPWGTEIDARWLYGTGLSHLEGSEKRPYRRMRPRSSTNLPVWLPIYGRYRFSFLILDWPYDDVEQPFSLIIDGEDVSGGCRRIYGDLLVEFYWRFWFGDVHLPRILTLVSRVDSLNVIEHFNEGIPLSSLIVDEIVEGIGLT